LTSGSEISTQPDFLIDRAAVQRRLRQATWRNDQEHAPDQNILGIPLTLLSEKLKAARLLPLPAR
jgi:hypothetical protein